MRVSKVELVALGLLAEGPLHGYELLERLRDRGMGLWVEVGRASVYQALRRLEDRGLVGGRAQAGVEGPERRVYRLTASGRARLRSGLRERFGVSAPYETPAALALGLAHLLPSAEARTGLSERDRALRERLAVIGRERERLAGTAGAGRVLGVRMLDLQEALASAEIAWLTSLRRVLGGNRR